MITDSEHRKVSGTTLERQLTVVETLVEKVNGGLNCCALICCEMLLTFELEYIITENFKTVSVTTVKG